jgi:hypothetical protein
MYLALSATPKSAATTGRRMTTELCDRIDTRIKGTCFRFANVSTMS